MENYLPTRLPKLTQNLHPIRKGTPHSLPSFSNSDEEGGKGGSENVKSFVFPLRPSLMRPCFQQISDGSELPECVPLPPQAILSRMGRFERNEGSEGKLEF